MDDLDAVEPRLLVSVLSVAAGGCVSRPKRVAEDLERARRRFSGEGDTSVQGATSASAQSAQRTSVWLKPHRTAGSIPQTCLFDVEADAEEQERPKDDGQQR
ncbi:MAG TPA: hypothetical protein VES79_14880 [Solirubrobacteraceae bacterium]|nr:hypothetical protein [Actinomycetota bacterium]HYM59244.1 hypothetical protein [Solirubrobacteraceae bacterium]